MMNVVEVSTSKIYPIEVLPVESEDYKLLSERRYFFNWEEEKTQETYKLVIKGQEEILGLISLERIPSEWRIHIRLLSVSLENRGEGKTYENIAGNLIAFVSKIAVKEFGEFACVSLRPKSSIAHHYITKYNMNVTGVTLSLEVPEILDLINRYEYGQ
ncbi:N-acetyltransferase [Aquirufa ecclesiirivi]|uniref:N-acetyltransferase n=1 Tax=Aquirufa ecclesiirivi TaxID=2715124 RepID=UPI0023D8788B|nr:N-acetyltransferase [Aquirufa ecclesiirivi]MDF0694115.1 N-acetyltransferase [Aquirufa ecclesiirivi]